MGPRIIWEDQSTLFENAVFHEHKYLEDTYRLNGVYNMFNAKTVYQDVEKYNVSISALARFDDDRDMSNLMLIMLVNYFSHKCVSEHTFDSMFEKPGGQEKLVETFAFTSYTKYSVECYPELNHLRFDRVPQEEIMNYLFSPQTSRIRRTDTNILQNFYPMEDGGVDQDYTPEQPVITEQHIILPSPSRVVPSNYVSSMVIRDEETGTLIVYALVNSRKL